MRLVAWILTLGCLSAGCAMQTGDPTTEDEPQRQNEIVSVSGGSRPIAPVSAAAATASPTPAPLAAATPAGAGGATIPAAGSDTSGTSIQADNPNPSPWVPHGGGH
jgi:hypothetical protein